ncbi:MAG: hypothetical protein ACFFCS_19825 [Candidatus Hodarchaeota archaeon]
MSKEDVQMFSDLLDVLEKRYHDGEIGETEYAELRKNYENRLEQAKKTMLDLELAPKAISIAGSYKVSEDTIDFSGAAKISGGKVSRDMKTSGSAKIEGDVECNGFQSSGSTKVEGNITAHGPVKGSGSFHCDGDISSEGNISFSGSTKVEGKINANGIFTTSGTFHGDSDLNTKRGVRTSGTTHIEGNISSEGTVELRGLNKVEGNISADNVRFISNKPVFLLKKKWKKSFKIEGNIIARNGIEIEDTEVKGDIHGRYIKIGPNVKIDGKVLYSDKLDIANNPKLEHKPEKVNSE